MRTMYFLVICSILLCGTAFAAGQLEGTVRFPSGQPYSNWITIDTDGGSTKVKADSSGRFSTSIKGCYVNRVYDLNGNQIWSGSVNACPKGSLSLTSKNP